MSTGPGATGLLWLWAAVAGLGGGGSGRARIRPARIRADISGSAVRRVAGVAAWAADGQPIRARVAPVSSSSR
jgi:hypothetical protein